jgi:Carboxypeptidase regulatory-like domain/TonB-dependent Receptor Plug Domain/TonB dependent receptor
LNPKTVSLVLFACILGVCLVASLPLHAQVTGATISGTITDATGAVIAGAEISVRNTDTGIIRNSTADSAGFYTVPNLAPGPYEVKVSAKGFNTAVQSNLTLAVGAQQQLNIPLKVGETSQTVQVTEAAPQIELTSSTLSGQIQAQEVRELPLNGRDWTSLATLSPGVNALETQQPFEAGNLRGNRGFGAQLTISGGRPTQNNYRLDGLSINDYGNAGPGSVIGGNLGVDAIQEFEVITGNYSAEYGKTSGGIVNAISKSGTNAFHGDAYEFLRNGALDANDFYSNALGLPKPAYRRNQFGASAGGPIRKNRTFIFGDYEGIRQAQGSPSGNSGVPSENARLGIIIDDNKNSLTYNDLKDQHNCVYQGWTPPNGTMGGCPKSGTLVTPLADSSTCPSGATNLAPGKAGFCVDNNAAKFLAIYPHPNGAGAVTGNVGHFLFAPTRVVTENYVTTRVDHKISDKDSLFATYMYDNSPFNTPDGFDTTAIVNQVTRHIAALEWTHTFTPALLNTARLGYNRNAVINYKTVGAINPAAADPSLSMMPGYDIPAFITTGWVRTSPGLPGAFTLFNWNSIQFYDDAFWTRGAHSLKFGFAVENMRYNPYNLYLPNALMRFNGTAGSGNGQINFLTNQPDSIEGGLPVGVSPRNYRQTLFGGYIQDDWRFRRNLTLNLGLRYEMLTVVTERDGKLSSLRNLTDPLPYCGTSAPSPTNVVFGQPGCAGVAPYYSNPTTRNFEPRIGFAWDPRGDGKMSVRGGFAIFDVLPLPGNWFSQNWEPFFLTGKISNSAATPLAGTLGILPGTATNPNPGSAYSEFFKAPAGSTCPLTTCALSGSYVDPNPKRNYVEQWNINFQRQITPSLTATVGYVGSHGVHMIVRGDDFDMVLPTLTSAGYLWPDNPTHKDLRINPNFGLIRGIKWNTGSTYEAGQFSVQKVLSHGFQVGGSYTYSKSMDDDSATVLGDAFSNSITTWFWFAPQISRAVSDYNFTHTAIINAMWQVPGPRAGLGRDVLGGWEVGGIFRRNSGVPTTPLIGGDPMGVQNSGSDTFGIPDRIPGCDPVNHNYKNTPGLIYINASCFHVPMAPADPAIASQCVPFTAVPGSCSNLLGNAGRNSIVGPPLTNLDFSMHKNIPVKKISESASVQFRAEFFNVLNHPNFGVPLPFTGASNAQIFNADGSAAGAPAGGLQQPLVTLPRDIQFALKLLW